MEYPRKFMNALRVYDVTNATKVRIGNQNDGGYVVLQELCEKTPVVYTFGVANDVGFEADWLQRYPKSRVKCHDPFIDELPQKHKRMSFAKYGIGSRWKSLKDVVPDSLLKMDIEGDEWSAFSNFEPDEIKKFSQIVCEFHVMHIPDRTDLSLYFCSMYDNFYEKINEDCFELYLGTFEFLYNWFKIVHIHANNSLPTIFVDGYRFPPLMEITLARTDLGLKFKPTAENFPISGLDFPNKTNRADILDYYPFPEINTNKRKV